MFSLSLIEAVLGENLRSFYGMVSVHTQVHKCDYHRLQS